MPVKTVESAMDFRKSVSHNFGVMTLNPNLFSILKVTKRLNGIEMTEVA
jgi:hypothetical protein